MLPDGKSSRLPNFFRLDLSQRLEVVKGAVDLTREEVWMLRKEPLDLEVAQTMVENVLGVMGMPLGLAVNFRINGHDTLVPMAVEETSVVAACSNAAKIVRENGELTAEADPSVMIAQIQVVGCHDLDGATSRIEAEKPGLLRYAAEQDPTLVRFGGGPLDLVLRRVESREGTFLVVHLLVDCLDAMGANAVNSMAEALAPKIEQLSGGKVLCRILSNLADRRLARARAVLDVEALARDNLPGEEAARRISMASALAEADPYRAATHNKGIMNGVDAVLIATGNDWRAVEAGAHAWAARDGKYTALATWQVEGDRLVGQLEMPMAVGIVGGVAAVHPVCKIVRKIMGVTTASELAQICVSVGLIQNMAALRALVMEGIQKGHMTLHAQNVARNAGALGDMVQTVARQMVREGKIQFDRAKEIVSQRLKGMPPR